MRPTPQPPEPPSTETGPTAASRDPLRPGEPRALLRLVLAHGQLDGRTSWTVDAAGMLLGRLALATPDGQVDPRVSRRHALIERVHAGWVLRDLGSRNRTRVNAAEVRGEVPLTAGDVICLGDTVLLFDLATAEAPAAPAVPGLVGDSPGLRAARRALAQGAAHETSILILGETGVGKEVVAQAVHRLSGRRGPFIALNCGGLAEGVLESELFGHVRGAFTGAVAGRDGLFRSAHQGTLFLDELGEMPLGLQVKLLRVLETRRVRPVGGAQELPVDVRVIAATHRDLVAAMRAGSFRTDLYARLAQWIIAVPPLRERREDLPALMVHLLGRLGAAGRRLAAPLVETLLLHPWPLNVRGLLNILSMSVVAAPPGGPLDLCPPLEQALAADRALAGTGSAAAVPGPREEEADERQRGGDVWMLTPAELATEMERHQGNVAKAARALGCSRQQLYRCLAYHGLDRGRFRPE